MFDRRYWIQSAVWAAAFIALCIVALGTREDSAARIAVVALLLALIAVAAFVELRMLRRMDELQLRIYQDAALVAMGVAIAFCGAGVVLQYLLGWAVATAATVLVVIGIGFVLGLGLALRRYR